MSRLYNINKIQWLFIAKFLILQYIPWFPLLPGFLKPNKWMDIEEATNENKSYGYTNYTSCWHLLLNKHRIFHFWKKCGVFK